MRQLLSTLSRIFVVFFIDWISYERASLLASRLDPVIISSKTQTVSSNLTSRHDIITTEELTGDVSSTVLNSLKSMPGIFINQTGGPGAQASIYLRGSQARHVLVLIDGVKVNDPSNPDKQFNIANLTSLDIEKIEILKGAQSVLYGSEAIGGVINIITKKGEAKQNIGLELGFQSQIKGSVSLVGDRSVSYLNLYAAQSEGLSAKKNAPEKDGYQRQGLTFNHSHSFDTFEAHWLVKFMNDFIEDDGYSASLQFTDDAKAYTKNSQQIFKQSLSFNKAFGTLNHSVAVNQMHRKIKFFDTFENNYHITKYEGLNLQNDFNLLKKFGLAEGIIGFSHEYESFDKTDIESKSMNLYSLYFTMNHQLRRNFFNVGLRADYHQAFGGVFNYNLGLGKKFSKRQSLKLNYATGFKAPTIYQLYVPYDGAVKVGNENLKPEQSKTIDLTYTKMGLAAMQISLFHSHIYNYFHYSSQGYSNKGSFNTQGIEMSAQRSAKKMTFKPALTLSQLSLSSGEKVLRRPEHKVDVGITYEISDHTSLTFQWAWVGARFDQTSAQDVVVLDAYDLSSILFSYKKKNIDVLLGVNNLFDREYSDVYDYSTLGQTAFSKLNYNY